MHHAHRRVHLIAIVLAALAHLLAGLASAATLPAGFTETTLASGLANPTAMEVAPDGRIFVTEQGGRVRVVKNGALLATPFATLPVTASGERGLLGVTFDPQFATNHFVYVYYTATTPVIHNRISRLTANGDVAVAGSEVVLVDLDPLSSATNHNGGAIHFGEDGKLYAAVGDNATASNAQTLANRLGKVLRYNRDGTIPADNPFYATASGANRAIWAMGLRNPYTFSFEPVSGRLFINDVGQSTWEEIDEGVAASNYGWPATEGPTTDSRFRSPVYAYQHGSGTPTGCAITGGAFYSPQGTVQFPAAYDGNYFFADFCGGWIDLLDTDAYTASAFATGIASPVDLKVTNDGALLYLARGTGSTTGTLVRIGYTSGAPQITSQPANRTVAIGQSATFGVTASGTAPLSYQWKRNGVDIPGATSATYTLTNAQPSDNGARFRVSVTNARGSATSNEAVLTVTGASAGDGLAATYFDNVDFTGTQVSRVDATVNFDWGTGAPVAGFGADTFSVRWTGQVLAPATQATTFHVLSDDGVRLWVNGQLLIDDWTVHGAQESSGTIALTAGRRYDVRLEYFDQTGRAQVRLSWSGPSTPKQVIPQSRLFSAAPILVNFQPAGAPVPAGYLVDAGAAFGPRGNGYSYGWNAATPDTRDRNAANAPDQRYDTLIHMQKEANPDAAWEIALPNGTYRVHIVAGDPGYADSVYRIAAEGVLVVTGTPTSAVHWVEGEEVVTVSDGRLTVTSATGAQNNKLDFIEITPQ